LARPVPVVASAHADIDIFKEDQAMKGRNNWQDRNSRSGSHNRHDNPNYDKSRNSSWSGGENWRGQPRDEDGRFEPRYDRGQNAAHRSSPPYDDEHGRFEDDGGSAMIVAGPRARAQPGTRGSYRPLYRPEQHTGDESDERQKFDDDYSYWRDEQVKRFDEDYSSWLGERRKKFSDEFGKWRDERNRARSGTSGSTDKTS
jgi:hypothetical protein